MHTPLNIHRTFREKIKDLWGIFHGELYLECLTVSAFFKSVKHTSAPIERVYQIPDNAAAQERHVSMSIAQNKQPALPNLLPNMAWLA